MDFQRKMVRRSWLKYDRDENVMTCIIQYVQSMVNEGKLEI